VERMEEGEQGNKDEVGGATSLNSLRVMVLFHTPKKINNQFTSTEVRV